MKRIVIEVTRKEMGVLAYYALRMAERSLNESAGWEGAARVLREAAETVHFQIDDSAEEHELRQRGVEVRKGMAFIDPKRAMNLMNSMAQDDSQFKDVPTITSLVRKIARLFRVSPPKVVNPPQSTAKPSDPLAVEMPASQHPGVEKAKYTAAEPTPDLMSPEDFERLYGRVGYEPSDPGRAATPPSEEAPALTPLPGTVNVWRPRENPLARQQRVASQDVAGSAGAQQAGPTDWRKGVATVQDPATQERTPDMEDPSKWDLEEAYRLLGIPKPLWRVKNV